jgi:hypothetical protein
MTNLRNASVSKEPPKTVTIKFCGECGRNDLVQPFTGKSHWHLGVKCSGQPERLVYVLRGEHDER